MRFKSTRLRLSKQPSASYLVEIGPAARLTSWDNLNYDVLVDIVKRLPWAHRLSVACFVNKSWFSAVLDTLSIPLGPGVINLKVMDSLKAPKDSMLMPKAHKTSRMITRRYLSFLKRMLDSKPPNYSWSTLYVSQVLLMPNKYAYIAKRTRSLQRLVIPVELGNTYSCFMRAMDYWRKLKNVQCAVSLFRFCLSRFKKVESLRLFGVVDDSIAKEIRDRCPRLKRLYLISCALSLNALSTILDGHKELEVLDTRHCFRVPDCHRTIHKLQSVEWNEEEIRHKAAGIKLHLRCTEQCCPKCSAPWRFSKAKNCFPDFNKVYI